LLLTGKDVLDCRVVFFVWNNNSSGDVRHSHCALSDPEMLIEADESFTFGEINFLFYEALLVNNAKH